MWTHLMVLKRETGVSTTGFQKQNLPFTKTKAQTNITLVKGSIMGKNSFFLLAGEV